jgi:3D (Asp-Asp-Asp) domain-containing protein
MRARTAIVAAALVAAVGVVAPAGAATRCRPSRAHVMASDRRVDVYTLGSAVYGCDALSGKRVRLGNAHICIAAACVDRAAVAGDLVAYASERCGVDTCSASVSVVRLPDAKQLRNFAAITGPGLVESGQTVGSIVVKRDASVAWIAADNSFIGRGSRIEVHANGKLLDSGGGIVPSSLRLHGSTLTWRDGGATRSATLS